MTLLLRLVYNRTLMVENKKRLFHSDSVLQPLRSFGDHSRRRLPMPGQRTFARRLLATSSSAFGDTVAAHLE